MESGRKKSGGVEIPKRERSLNLKSLCESRFSKLGGSKRKVSCGNDQEDAKKKKKKKFQNEVPLSSYESDAKKSRNKDDGNDTNSEVDFKEKSGGSIKLLHDTSLALVDNGSLFKIPKRPRGSVGRKKLESDQGSEPLRLSNSVDRVGALEAKVIKSDDKGGLNDQSVRSVTISDGISSSRLVGKAVGSSTKSTQKADSKFSINPSSSNVKLKQKVGANEDKRKKDSRSDLVQHIVKESNRVANNGDTSPKKWWSNSRKRKDLVVHRDHVEASLRKSKASNSLFNDALDDEYDDDDEENLEQNAARMLSSRFDPSCTGFSSKKRSSVSQTADESCFPFFSARESASGDDNSRALRPRRGDKDMGALRKRRHFYEVVGGGLDPYWVLKRRIKIFWPLDDNWYDGIVNDYHSKTKLHHIKYDDKDEEWVNLEEEKFKLLLLHSDVPGKPKYRNRFTGNKDLHIRQTVPPADDDIGNSLDSEPIALWLASQSQRVKALSKSPKRQKTSPNHLPLLSSVASEETDFSNDGVGSSRTTINKPGCESASAKNVHMVYVRKKNQKKSAASSSVSIDAKACGNAPQKQLRYFDDKCKPTVSDALLESQEFRFQICIPLLPYWEFSCGIGFFWMLHDVFMLQHGVIMTTSPAVFLEMLFIDSNLGLRFLLYEGCLKQSLAIVFQILMVFCQSDEHCDDEKKIPVNSIRFQLSSVYDLRKQHIFVVYRFSKLQSSKWLYLESKILQQCLLIKQLSFSECTYGNIKKLECGIFPPCKPGFGLELSSSEYFKKKFELGILPGKVSQLPTLFLNLHLQSLMERSFARANLQHQDAMCSQETSEKAAVEDITTEHVIRQLDSVYHPSRDLSSNQRIDGSVLNSNPTGSKRFSKRSRSSTDSPVWSDGKPNFVPNGFSYGPKKPRTQVQYTLPFAVYDFSRKQEMPSSGSLPCKRIRRASLRRISDDSGNNQKNLESLICSANVLVTNEGKGWRECGAHVVLEVADDNEWRLAVKISGVTKFSHKVKHILQPGSTNRYSHAMIWKGEKDWVLEFPDRSQWMLFKEMYEECYDRNIRAASVKNIPIPGVRLVGESGDYGDEAPFVRNPTLYFRQVQSDAEMALDSSRVVYDMDSDDEQWLMAHKNCAEQISDEFFEMTMDVFEKVSYARGRDNFTDCELEDLAIGVGSVEAAKLVYQHWRQKREEVCMPLIRHFQPPPWERYQRQLKEWEQNVARDNCPFSVGQDKEKPPMFAFCLKPRGLEEINNKGSKQRPHRKFPVYGNHHAFSGVRDSPLVYGRRSNGHAFSDEKVLYMSSMNEFFEVSPYLHPSARVWSPRDARFSLSTEWKVNHRKRCKDKPKKLASRPYFHSQRSMSHKQRTTGNRIGDRPSNLKHLDISNLDEFYLRDALGAAKHAREMAKSKRENARSLLCKADLAIQKAVSTLMNAEAMKDFYENSNGVN